MKSYLYMFMIIPFFSYSMHSSIQDAYLAQELDEQRTTSPDPLPPMPHEAAPFLNTTDQALESYPYMPVPSPVHSADGKDKPYYSDHSGEIFIPTATGHSASNLIKETNEPYCTSYNATTCVTATYCCCVSLCSLFLMFYYPFMNV